MPSVITAQAARATGGRVRQLRVQPTPNSPTPIPCVLLRAGERHPRYFHTPFLLDIHSDPPKYQSVLNFSSVTMVAQWPWLCLSQKHDLPSYGSVSVGSAQTHYPHKHRARSVSPVWVCNAFQPTMFSWLASPLVASLSPLTAPTCVTVTKLSGRDVVQPRTVHAVPDACYNRGAP